MTQDKGVYEITNNEGMICFVDTTDSAKKTYGKNWVNVCESALHGKVLKAEIVQYQYRTHQGERTSDIPTGFVVKIDGEIESFLPFRLSKFREFEKNYDGETIAVMVESFDPNSLSIIVREITITDQDIDINLVNEAIELIGKAYEDGKYIRGTIVAEKRKWAENESDRRRAGYIVTINGVETFLPVSLSFYNSKIPISDLVGTNIICGVEEINVEKMTITLSMKAAYEKLVYENPTPKIDALTKGLVVQVTPYNVHILLPQNVYGTISRHMFPDIEHNDLLKLTGSIINCIPFKIKSWDESNNDRSMLVSFQPQGNS